MEPDDRLDVDDTFEPEYQPMSWGARIGMVAVALVLLAPVVYAIIDWFLG